MTKHFNTAGPNNPDWHYTLPPLQRWDLEEVLSLIRQNKYFILHAPRQTGKTTSLLALTDLLNQSGEYLSVYANIETAQVARDRVDEGMRSVLSEINSSLKIQLKNHSLEDAWFGIWQKDGGGKALNELLKYWASSSEKPTVLILDEVDALVGDTLISLLRQIRSGYAGRPAHFPASVILCGIRDVRDYRIYSDQEKTVITGGSAFNIKAESLRLGDFSKEDIKNLYQQHTDTTGQTFEDGVLDQVFGYTGGQPWLVNALAYEACFRMEEGKDRSTPISVALLEQAKENLILRKDTHLDQLADKLKEERVKRVIEPLLANDELTDDLQTDDARYVADLGLIRLMQNGKYTIANGIYREVIPRELSWDIQTGMSTERAWYITETGLLDMDKLLDTFQQFFREHSESWLQRFQYHEAGPQLLMQAFLQRIVNGGGRIDREYGLGRGRTDLYIQWPLPDGSVQREVIELKVLRYSLEKTIEKGLEQTTEYMDKCGAPSGHLVLFDRRENVTWEEKIFRQEKIFEGKIITVWGC